MMKEAAVMEAAVGLAGERPDAGAMVALMGASADGFLRDYLLARRRSLLQELSFIERRLGIQPRNT